MSGFVSLVQEVEGAIAGGDASKRVETLRKMTDLFVEQSAHLQDQHVNVFDEVIMRLSHNIEFRARLELSDKLADIQNAPKQVVRDLAFDDNIQVASPVLERSSRLDEKDLIAIAQEKGQVHLLSLSKRSTLSENVTDILVVRGDQTVVRSVAGNQGAKFSDGGYSQLMEKARNDETLQRTLKTRSDIPVPHMQRLIEVAREKVRENLQSEFGNQADKMVESALNDVSQAMATSQGSKILVDDFIEAEIAVERKERSSAVAEEDVIKWLKDGQIEEAIVAMAKLAHVPVDMVSRAYHAAHYDPMLFIIRAIKFSWPTFKMILTVKAGRQPPQDLMKSAFDAFQQLSVQTAQRVVRFTAVRDHAGQPNAA